MVESKQYLIENLQKLATELGKSPTVKDVRDSDIFDSEYRLVKEFGTFNKAKIVAGIEIVQENTNSIDEEIIKDGDLAYFLGVLAGDGSIVELSNGSYRVSLTCKDKEMLEEFTSIGEEKFGIKAVESKRIVDNKNYGRVDFCSKDFGDYLGDWSFENWHLRLMRDFSWIKRNYAEEFLSGLFDAEGTNSGRIIRFYCQNDEAREVIRMMLEELGMKSNLNKRSVTIRRSDVDKFKDKINPRISRKVVSSGIC